MGQAVLTAEWLALVAVTLAAALVQGIAGFGFTLLALSAYLVALQSTDAVQLVIIINFTVSAVLIGRLWRHVPARLWALLAVGGVLGFPVGIWLFARADVAAIELAVAILAIGFALTVMVQELRAGRRGRRGTLRTIGGVRVPGGGRDRPDDGNAGIDDAPAAPTEGSGTVGRDPVARAPGYRSSTALAIGACGGGLTALLGAPGPPVALYLAYLRLDKITFRALALSTFIVMQAGAWLSQAAWVGVDARVGRHALVLAPVAAVGALVGDRLSGRVSELAFRRLVLLMLLAAGAYMFYRATGPS